jgi:hypothetical protein
LHITNVFTSPIAKIIHLLKEHPLLQ